MLKDDFKFVGGDAIHKQFIETFNMLCKLINGLTVDLGENGGTDLAKIEQTASGLKIDLTQLYIPPYDPTA